MPLYKVTAFNLRVACFGEADKVVTVFSRERGKLKVLAKGARKSRSKLSGRTELFVHSRMALATGRNFEILTDAQIIESFSELRRDLSRLNLALYFVWLVDQISPLAQPQPPVFDLLEKTFLALVSGRSDLEALKSNFEKRLAVLEGVSPLGANQARSLKKYFEYYLDRVYPAYFGEVAGVCQ